MIMAVRSLFDRLGADQRGNVAMIAAITFLVMIVIGGAAVDLQRAFAARSHAQDAIDLAAVAAASSRHTDTANLKTAAEDWLGANAEFVNLNGAPEIDVQVVDISRIDMTLTGTVRTFFMGLVGIETLPVEVTTAVERGAVDRVELALVLDNTWSMSEPDAMGVRKIDALKSAARNLVDALMTRQDESVKVGVVPYADYVNVGLGRRSAPWLDVAPDSTRRWTENRDAVPRTCEMRNTRRVCTNGPPKTCTRAGRDGVTETYNCTEQTCRNETVTPYEVCSGGTPASSTPRSETTRWHGCVGSRRQGNARLHDTGAQKYPGIMTTSSTPNCLTEITPLTDRKSTVTSALTAMIINRGGYRPSTYIPAGAIWGVNMLSPTEPLSEAAAYQETNRNPRKIMVLMTDGANTMRFNPGDGTHSDTSVAAQRRATDDDTAAICTYAKSKGIEVYTVALAVGSSTARDLLQACASGDDHYFDARDSRTLAQAFADIAASIYRVRIVE